MTQPSRPRRFQPHWQTESLEPRLLLAGDVGHATCPDASTSSDILQPQTRSVTGAKHLVFVDPQTPELTQLILQVDSSHEIVLLNDTNSGLDQISRVLQSRSGIQSIHIVGHGNAGQIVIGNQVVSEKSLIDAQQQVRDWSKALSANADILLYGCNTGSGNQGDALIRQLASLTGADVAASTDITGDHRQGGDWDLERQLGTIETAIAFDTSTRQRYTGTLAITIDAAGATGEERLYLQIDGVTVATFEDIGGDLDEGEFVTLTHDLDGVSLEQVRLVFDNDLYDVAGGIDRNVRIDSITIDGVVHQTEAIDTYSTGTWKDADGVTPGYRQSETLHSNGFLQFGASDSTIAIRAAGSTGEETFDLQIDGVTVATFDATVTEQTFSFDANEFVIGSRVSVAFTNDLFDETTDTDRNLIVNNISIGALTFETEDSSVYSTGTWLAIDGIVPGFRENETLHINGQFQFADYDGTPTQPPSGHGSLISINAAGDTGSETMRLKIDGVTMKSWDNVANTFAPYTYETNEIVTPEQIQVVFGNDAYTVGGFDRNLRVDNITLDGVLYETEDAFVYSSGTWKPSDGVVPGFRESETLHSNGFFRYSGQTAGINVGAIALAENFYSVNETDSSVEVTFVRTLGDEGPISVDYTLYSDTATADFDFVTSSGTVTMIDGQTTASVVIPILDDELDEGAESFIFTIDNQSAGALLLAPRSATIEIVDDENPTGGGGPGDDPVPDIDVEANIVLDGLVGTTAIDFTPDGSIMYIANFTGFIQVFTGGELQQNYFINLQNQVNGTRGLLDIAVHPDFVNNPYIYLAYAYDPPEVNNYTGLAGPDGAGNRASRVTRVTADVTTGYTTAVAGSEVILLGANGTWDNFNGHVDSTIDFDEPPSGILADGTNLPDFMAYDSQSHGVDAVEFGPDGMLYVSNGDGTSYNQVDARAVRVQDIDNLSGKVLRVDPITGEGLTDNPFFDGDPDANRSKVYQYGFRNPFRIAIDDATGQVYVGDVGWSEWEEINAGDPGDNFGWPYYEGGNGIAVPTIFYQDLPEAQAFYASGETTTAAIVGYQHDIDGIDALTLGDIYTGTDLGPDYQGSLIYSRLGSGVVQSVQFLPNGDVDAIKTIAVGHSFLVQMVSAPDGHLYFVDFDDGTIGYWTLV
ncbi:MAG: DUF4347 domain-containing protein [Pirellulaceae bacterium]